MIAMLPPAFTFALDAMVVVLVAWRTLCSFGLNRHGLVEATLGWMLLALVWIVGAGVVLGWFGGLGPGGFLGIHLLGLVAFYFFRRNWQDDLKQARGFLGAWWRLISARTAEGLITVALIIALLFLAVLAAQVDPATFDALTYRLSRIGQWLQDGSIANYATDDPRINYMPVGPDLVIAWFLGATSEGFRMAPLSQLWGGVLALGATFGLARLIGLSRLAAFGAVALLLGMANVAVQFTTIQSDLFTAGVFSSAYLLWHRALLRRRSSAVGALGIALAWGSKGTLFYLAPGAALWVFWLVWRYRAWRTLLPTVWVGAAALVLFVGPGYFRNIKSYHSLLGPREAVLLHHGGSLTLDKHLDKLAVNLHTSAVQLFDPTAQPFWCEEGLRKIGRTFLPGLSTEDDPYLFLHTLPRRMLVEGILQQVEPDADIVSCGIVAAVLFTLGALVAMLRWRNETARQVAVWSAGVIMYLLVQHALVQWHQWAFRFVVLVAPWMAVVGAWTIDRLGARWRLAVWLVVVISSIQVAVRTQWRAHQAAWLAWSQPHLGLPQFVYSHWRSWGGQLDTIQAPLRLALPINYPLAAFYRKDPLRPVTMENLSTLKGETAEAALSRDAWLVVPALKFLGREGSVMGSTWLYAGEGNGIHSLAAFRTLRPGESPLPMLYRSVHVLTADGLQRRILVRSWKPKVGIRLQNPSGQPWDFEVTTASGSEKGTLPVNGEMIVTAAVSSEYVSEVVVDFHSLAEGKQPNLYPSASLMRP